MIPTKTAGVRIPSTHRKTGAQVAPVIVALWKQRSPNKLVARLVGVNRLQVQRRGGGVLRKLKKNRDYQGRLSTRILNLHITICTYKQAYTHRNMHAHMLAYMRVPHK